MPAELYRDSKFCVVSAYTPRQHWPQTVRHGKAALRVDSLRTKFCGWVPEKKQERSRRWPISILFNSLLALEELDKPELAGEVLWVGGIFGMVQNGPFQINKNRGPQKVHCSWEMSVKSMLMQFLMNQQVAEHQTQPHYIQFICLYKLDLKEAFPALP